MCYLWPDILEDASKSFEALMTQYITGYLNFAPVRKLPKYQGPIIVLLILT